MEDSMTDNPTRACPVCGSVMRQGFKTQTVEYRGRLSPPYDQPGLWCQGCGEGLISFIEMEVGAVVMRQLRDQVESQTFHDAF
jgi:YgiT-type zinc finger domain-containing protein